VPDLLEVEAVSVHFKDPHVMGKAVEHGAGEPLGAEESRSTPGRAACRSPGLNRARSAD
jgi:hypothetical protein